MPHKHHNHHNTMQDYATNLSQAERLAAMPVSPFVEIRDDESEVISRPPNGFRMPSMSRVREHDARLTLNGSNVNVRDDDDDENGDDESELYEFAVNKRRDSLRDNSLVLPSARGFREAFSEAISYGFQGE